MSTLGVMQQHTRAVVAYIVGRLSTQKPSPAVYDQLQKQDFRMEGEVSAEKVNVFDYAQDCHVIGDKGENGFTLYHYGTQKEITLKVEGKKFSGFDSDSSKSFSSTFNGKTVQMFDYETRKEYTFVLR